MSVTYTGCCCPLCCKQHLFTHCALTARNVSEVSMNNKGGTIKPAVCRPRGLKVARYIHYGLLGLRHVRDHAVRDDEQDEVLRAVHHCRCIPGMKRERQESQRSDEKAENACTSFRFLSTDFKHEFKRHSARIEQKDIIWLYFGKCDIQSFVPYEGQIDKISPTLCFSFDRSVFLSQSSPSTLQWYKMSLVINPCLKPHPLLLQSCNYVISNIWLLSLSEN